MLVTAMDFRRASAQLRWRKRGPETTQALPFLTLSAAQCDVAEWLLEHEAGAAGCTPRADDPLVLIGPKTYRIDRKGNLL